MTATIRMSRYPLAAAVLAGAGLLMTSVSPAQEPPADAALGKEQAELQGRVVQALQAGDRIALYVAMDEYRALEKAGAKVPAGLYFAEAEAARTQRDPVRAERAYGDYFRIAQSEGEVFNEALRAYADWKNTIPASAWVILDGMVPVPGQKSPAKGAKGSAGAKIAPLGPFSIGRNEVTRAQFRTFLTATGYRPKGTAPPELKPSPDAQGDASCSADAEDWTQAGYEQTDSDPVVCVSWDDARAYISWLNQSTGLEFRLPSAREWDYAATGGASTKYWFGDVHDPAMGNGPGMGGADRWTTGTAPVGQFPANPFGLNDMVGNAAEWVADCPDGAAAAPGQRESTCMTPAIRGSSWQVESTDRMSNGETAPSPASRSPDLGFRLATGS